MHFFSCKVRFGSYRDYFSRRAPYSLLRTLDALLFSFNALTAFPTRDLDYLTFGTTSIIFDVDYLARRNGIVLEG